jgi:tetratricopeptide (TPR) repeat protein
LKDAETATCERSGTDVFAAHADPLRVRHAVPLDIPGWLSECRRPPAKGSAEYWWSLAVKGRENPEMSDTYALRKALEVSPDHLPAKLRLAHRLILEYKFSEAHQHLSEALAAKSQHPRNAAHRQNLYFLILYNQGLCQYQMGQFNRALTTIDRAVQFDPAREHATELKALREIRFWCYFRLNKGTEEFNGMLAASEICMDEQRRTTAIDPSGLAAAAAGVPQQSAERLSIQDGVLQLSDVPVAESEKQQTDVPDDEPPMLWLDAVLEELNKSPAERDAFRCAELCKNLSFFQRLGREEGAQILSAAEPRRLDTASSILFKRRVLNDMERESMDTDRKDTKNFSGLDEIFVLLSGTAELQFQPAKPAEDTGTGTSWPGIKSTFRAGDPISFSDNHLQGLLTETLADSQDMPGGVREWNAVVLSLEPCWLLQIDPTEYMRVVRSSVGERDLADQVALLRRIPLFHSVMDAQLKDIASRLQIERYNYGDVVVHPGVATAGLYILWQGNANIVLPTSADDCSRDVLNKSSVLFKMSSAAYCGFGAIKDPPETPQMAMIVTSCKADFFLLPKKGLTSILEVLPKMQAMVGKAVDPLAPTDAMLKRAKRSMGQWTFFRRNLLEKTVHHPEKMSDHPTSPLGEVPPPRPNRKTALISF